MDTIRRRDAIDALTRKMVSIPTAGEKDLMGNANRIRAEDISVIKRLPSAQQWIPCSERLPEVYEAYIVSGKQKYEFETEWSYFVDVAVYDPTGERYIGPWQTFVDWKEGQETYITAWMKLPEPYKGEANED